MPAFNWDSVSDRAADDYPLSVAFSSYSVNLVLDALGLMHDRFRWEPVDDAVWDEIEAAVSAAENELMSGDVP